MSTRGKAAADTPPTLAPLLNASLDTPLLIVGVPRAVSLNKQDQARWEAWAARLAAASRSKVVTKLMPATGRELLESMRAGLLHLCILSPWVYIYGHAQGWVEPGPLLTTWNGQPAFPLMIVARTDAGLAPGRLPRVLEQLRGKHPCYSRSDPRLPDVPPLESFILPAGLLAARGVSVGAPVWVDAGKSVAAAVFRKECDFAALLGDQAEKFPNLIPSEFNVSVDRWANEMQVLASTPPLLPLGLLALSAVLPQADRDKLNGQLLGLPAPWDPSVGGVAPFQPALFDEFARLLAAANVDLQPYIEARPQTPTAAPRRPKWQAPPRGTIVVDAPLQGGAPFLPYWSMRELNRLILPAIYAELVRLDPSGHYFPYLAAELPTWQNRLARFEGQGADTQFVVEFRLRPGAAWQDGAPLTAADLVFSWNYVMDPAWYGSHVRVSGPAPEIYVSSVTAPSAQRVEFRFMSQLQAQEAARTGGRLRDAKLYAHLKQQTGPVIPVDYLEVGRNVLPAHLLKDIPPARIHESGFAQRPVFAGAYRVVEGGADEQQVVLEACATCVWGAPATARIVFGAGYYSAGATTYWQPPAELLEAFKAGAIHAQIGLPPPNARLGEDLRSYDAFQTSNVAAVNWVSMASCEMLDFNLDNAHLADLRVRQAIASAIDRQHLVDTLLAGQGELPDSYLAPWHPLASSRVTPVNTCDPARARSLLREAGYDLSQFPARHALRGPLRLRLASMDVYVYSRPAIAAAIQSQLAAVGIQVDTAFYSWPEFEGVDCRAIRNGRRFDLGLAANLGMDRYPLDLVNAETSADNIPSPTNGCPIEKKNWSGWRSPRGDALLRELRNTRRALLDPDAYKELWAEHQDLWTHELPSLPLFLLRRPVVTTSGLEGVRPGPFSSNGTEDTWNLWEWRLRR